MRASSKLLLAATGLSAILGIAVFGSGDQLFSGSKEAPAEGVQVSTGQAPDYLLWDADKRRDPETGAVPSERRYAVLRQLLGQQGMTLRQRMPLPGQERAKSSSDLSYSWQQIDDAFASLAVTGITFDPQNPDRYYFCTGEGWFNADAVRGAGIFRSENAGMDWEQLPATATADFWYCQDILVHPQTGDVYVATRSAGIQRSSDHGETWEQVLGSGNGSVRNSVCDLELTADGGVFAGIGIFETDGLYYSPNGDPGTWTKQTNGFPGTGIWRIEIATAPSNPDVAYAVPLSTDGLIDGVYRTADRGNTWTAVNNPGGDRNFAASQAWYDLILAVDPNDENVVAAGGLDVWRSRNGGMEWQRISSGRPDSLLTRYMHVDQHGIFFVNSDTVYFTNDGGIYRSDNFRSDYPLIYDRNKNYRVVQYYAADIAPEAGDFRLIGGTQDNGSHIALGSGLGPFKLVSGADGSYCRFDHREGDRFYTSKQFEPIYRFDQGGFELPDTLDNPLVSNNHLRFINPIEMDPNDPGLLYQASSRGLQRLSNAASATPDGWEQASKNIGEISAIGISTNPPNIVFLGRRAGNAEILRLDDASTSNLLSSPEPTDPNNDIPDVSVFSTVTASCIAVDTADANHVVVSYSNYGVSSLWESRNALSTSPSWTAVEGNLPDLPVNWVWLHPGRPGVAYIATDLGIFFTDQLNGEDTEWQHDNFPHVRTDMIRFRSADATLVAATHGRGLFTARLLATAAGNALNWVERGPDNIGGRTRALMVDPNDPGGETVWAGSVSGGLWLTRGISSVGIVQSPAPLNPALTVSPNPFSSVVQLSLRIPEAGGGHLRIMNLKGELVSTVGGQQWVAGTQSIFWKPEPGLPAGVYLAVWEGVAGRQTAKLLYQP